MTTVDCSIIKANATELLSEKDPRQKPLMLPRSTLIRVQAKVLMRQSEGLGTCLNDHTLQENAMELARPLQWSWTGVLLHANVFSLRHKKMQWSWPGRYSGAGQVYFYRPMCSPSGTVDSIMSLPIANLEMECQIIPQGCALCSAKEHHWSCSLYSGKLVTCMSQMLPNMAMAR